MEKNREQVYQNYLVGKMVKSYIIDPKEGKRREILSALRIFPVYVDSGEFLVTVEHNRKHYYPVYTASDLKDIYIGEYFLSSIYDIVEWIKNCNKEDFKYKIDGIIVDPKGVISKPEQTKFMFTLEELQLEKYLYQLGRKIEYLSSLFDKKELIKLDKAIENYIEPFKTKTVTNKLDSNVVYPELDIKFNDLVLIGGRPAMGKTAFAINLMLEETIKKKKVIYFSSQMPIKELARKVAFNIGDVDLINRELNRENYSRIKNSLSEYKKNNTYFLDDAFINIEEIEKIVNKLKPSMIILDYLHIFHIGNKLIRGEDLSIKAMKKLKNIAKKNKCKVIVLTQLNRRLENRKDKHPRMSDIRETSKIGEIADSVYMLYRDDCYNNVCTKNNYSNLEVTELKNKENKTYKFNKTTGTLIK